MIQNPQKNSDRHQNGLSYIPPFLCFTDIGGKYNGIPGFGVSSVSGPRLSKPVGDGAELSSAGEVGGKQNKWLSSALSCRR